MMLPEQIIQEIEVYVRQLMDPANLDIKAHDWKHAFRVRNWMAQIAKGEGYTNLFLAQASALLHDIGRLKEHEINMPHSKVSAIMLREYLADKSWFSDSEKEELLYAIGNHSKGGDTLLTNILQDADRLDGFGPIGIMRSLQHKWHLPDYDPEHLFNPFSKTKEEIDDFFQNKREGELVPYALDFLGYHISWYDHMNTATGKTLGAPLIAYTKEFIEAFKHQANAA